MANSELSGGEAWPRRLFNSAVCTGDPRGSPTVHHNHHPYPLSEWKRHHLSPSWDVILLDLSTSRVRGQKKVWICLFTCCVVRAVHLELVMDMSTPTFLCYFRRFVDRRGLPKQMISDNGKTFKAAAKTISDIKWTFNVPKAPWWGGVFE